MGGKKSSAPKPDYRAMANRLSQWQHEDAEWYRISMDEAKNVHNRELGRAKARYGASGGSTDKIAEIEAEHKRKLQETEASIEKQYREKQRTLRSGATYKELYGRFSAIKSGELSEQYNTLVGEEAKEQFLKENRARAMRIPYAPDEHGVAQQSGLPTHRVLLLSNPSTGSDEEFMSWARSYGNFRPAEREEPEMEQIATRRGERPRRPIVGLPVEQNPWL